MSGESLPDGWKNQPEYEEADAVTLWAFALFGVPMNQPNKASERKNYRREEAAAKKELLDNVPVQTKEYMADVRKRAGGYEVGRFSDWEHCATYTVKEKRQRRYFLGPDLAAYAKQRGRPGLFGFEDEAPPSEWGFTHDTKLLRIAREVIRDNWEGSDPSRGPSKDGLVQDLIDRHGLTKNEAQAVDLVTRPDSRRKSPTK